MPKRSRSFCYEYERPSVTADAVVWTVGEHGWRILLIERRSDPFAGHWALPGGFVNPEEPPLDACIRELREETHVDASDFHEVGAFGAKGRDPRGWTISSAFFTVLPEGTVKSRAGDDASRTAWHAMDRLPELAFDHAQIIAAARRRLRSVLYVTPIASRFFAKAFTAAEASRFFRTLDDEAPRTGAAVVERLESFGIVKRTRSDRWQFTSERKKKA